MPPAEAHVLLFPEDIASEFPIDSVVYGTVISTRDGVATIGLLSAPHTEVRVPHTLVPERRVDPTEFSSGAVGEWMRKAVVSVDGGRYVYGQVVSYEDDTVTIRNAVHFVTVGTEDLQEIAPVLCFLLVHSDKTVDEVTSDELANHHVAILDCLLGITLSNGRSQPQPVPVHATQSIQRLLATFLPSRIHPRGTGTRPWINMFTGEETTVSCQHAINSAHFVDGNNRASPTMHPSLGGSFDDDPSQRVESTTSNATTPPPPSQLRAQASSPRVCWTDPTPTSVPSQLSNTPTNPADEIEALLYAVASSSVPPSSIHPTRLLPQSTHDDTTVADNHAKILAAIADNPSLVRFYRPSCQPVSVKHAVPAVDHRPTQRHRLDGPSDLIYGDDATVRRPKHVFAPTRVQQAINDLISAEEHSGREPTSHADSMLSSRATKFKPHPAIIARVCAFEFGARGLSICTSPVPKQLRPESIHANGHPTGVTRRHRRGAHRPPCPQ